MEEQQLDLFVKKNKDFLKFNGHNTDVFKKKFNKSVNCN